MTLEPVAAVVRWLDENTEKYLMVVFYAALALIISVEVGRRYITDSQTQWGSTVSIYCFIWLSWLGCAYHVKTRNHLRFDVLRKKMPKGPRAALFILDDLLWLLVASIVMKSSVDLIAVQMRLGSVIEGTGSIPLALATASVPVGWLLIVIRAVQDIWRLVSEYRSGAILDGEELSEID